MASRWLVLAGGSAAIVLTALCYLLPRLAGANIFIQMLFAFVAAIIAGAACVGLLKRLEGIETEAPWVRYATIGVLLVGTFVLFSAFLLGQVATARQPAVPIISFFLAIVPAVFYASLVVMLDRYEREPLWLLVFTFLWGASVALLFAIAINTTFSQIATAILGNLGAVVTATLSAPFSEELGKGAAVLILFLFLRKEFDNTLDGIVYGALAGLGFAMAENILFFTRAYTSGEIAGLAHNFYIRVVLGGFAHAAYTAVFGAALGYARETHSSTRKIVVPIVGLVLGMVLHGSWNLIGAFVLGALFAGANPILDLAVISPLRALAFNGPPIAVLIAIAYFVSKREVKIIREHLRPEVEAGLLTREEYERLSSSKRRWSAEWDALKTRGARGWYQVSQFHQVATELAFRRHHLSRGEQPKGHQKVWTDQDYHARLQALRQPRGAPSAVAAAVPSAR